MNCVSALETRLWTSAYGWRSQLDQPVSPKLTPVRQRSLDAPYARPLKSFVHSAVMQLTHSLCQKYHTGNIPMTFPKAMSNISCVL